MERGFHDAIVCNVRRDGGNLVLAIENVAVYDADRELGLENGQLIVRDLVSIIEDDVAVSAPTVTYADGSILDLELAPTDATLLVEWRTYQPASSTTMEYVIKGREIEWQPSGTIFSRSDL